jgi:ubiquinone/menaquinone biosynthesis C-methylase UbiE
MVSENRAAALFTQVDHSGDPDSFIRFMDEGHKLPDIQASAALMVERLAVEAGGRVLDVGCGPGVDLLALAARVGPSGRLVGIDASAAMIAEARRRAQEQHIVASFDLGDAQALAFPDAGFDVCRTQRVLMHVPDAQRALAEMVRVTRSGGRVGVFDFDWNTLVIDSPDKETTRAIVLSFSDSLQHGWIGRQLPRLFWERLAGVRVEPCRSFCPMRSPSCCWPGTW